MSSNKFTLEWEFPKDNGAVLKFDNNAWDLFQSIAKKRGIEAEEMISVAVAEVAGPNFEYRLRD